MGCLWVGGWIDCRLFVQLVDSNRMYEEGYDVYVPAAACNIKMVRNRDNTMIFFSVYWLCFRMCLLDWIICLWSALIGAFPTQSTVTGNIISECRAGPSIMK